jgi:hypothetical protein
MIEALVCDFLYTQSNMSLFGSQNDTSCCKNEGIYDRGQEQCNQCLPGIGRHLQFTERNIFMLVSDNVQEYVFETRNTKT